MFKGWQELFTYSKSQRRGIYMLLFIIFLLQGYLWYLKWQQPDTPLPVKVTLPKQQKLKNTASPNSNNTNGQSPELSEASKLFHFDPNTVSVEQLRQLGLSQAQAHTFVKYRSSGVQFREPRDMLEVYSVSKSWYKRVESYVTIDSARQAYQDKEPNGKGAEPLLQLKPFNLNEVTLQELEKMGLKKWQASKIMGFREKFRPFLNKRELLEVYGLDSALAVKLLPYATVDSARAISSLQVELSTADSATLAAVPGIGGYTAARIIEYRKRLGGYYSVNQIYEIHGADSTRIARFMPYLLLDSLNINTLNINKAEFKELLQHPYLSYEIVKSIDNYRTHVGDFTSVQQLRNIPLVNDVLFSKIANYLKTQ